MTGWTTLRTSGHCRCVPCKRREWWGPLVPALAWPWCCAALASSFCTVSPSFLASLLALNSHPCPRTRPLISLYLGTIARTPPRRANPVSSFFLFSPLELALREREHHGQHSPHLVTRRCLLSTPPPLPGALRHHPRPPSYKIPPCVPSLHPTSKSEAERIELVSSSSA
jgi:hypothetical protein